MTTALVALIPSEFHNGAMFCPHCRVHYSGGGEKGCCPYCGREGEPSRSTPAVTVLPAVTPPAGPLPAAPAELDRTRTESQGETWPPGTILAEKYEVLTQLGSGGFGSVYKVRHVFRKKHYALKTPHPEFAADDVFRRRFEREIEAMERFVHPDAVMIRDSGVTAEGRPYYTMDFIEGESLKDVLRREGKFAPERAVPIVLRVLRVLDVSHSHGIVHRDIKPDNILLTGVNGREGVKVLDFGVAKLLDLVGESKNITRGDRVGTPRYMSPEQITGEPTDPRSDLFSLGIVFYEMVTGSHPFDAGKKAVERPGDLAPLTHAILNQTPAPPRDVVPSISRIVSDQIVALLEKKARRRPASAAVVIQALESAPEIAPYSVPAARLSLHPRFPRARAGTLVLRETTPDGERRCFLFFGDEVRIGRSNDPARGIENDVILRCLPCRSRAADPENWARNLTISHQAANIYPVGHILTIDPSPGVKHGIAIGGVKSYGRIRIQGDRFHLGLGDRALELDGFRVETSPGETRHDLAFLAEGRPEGAGDRARTGYSNAACGIDSVSLFRPENWPLHEYHMVCRALRIGAAAGCPLRIGKAPAAEVLLIHEAGEAFLLGLGKGARAAPPPTGDDTAAEVDLSEGVLHPLSPGVRLTLGENRFLVTLAADSDFKTT